MTEYTLDVNGKRYELNKEFRESLQRRAEYEYEDNEMFSCWWKVEDNDPILVIETQGKMVPWEQLDHLGADIDDENSDESIFGRTHFSFTPRRFEEVPTPEGEDPNKIPPEPEELDNDPKMVMWVPEHPNIEHTWSAGEAIAPMYNWIEWNVQLRADQPKPNRDKQNSHDSFESLCRMYDCDVVGKYTPSNDIPSGDSGSVQRKGKKQFEDGKYGGDNFTV